MHLSLLIDFKATISTAKGDWIGEFIMHDGLIAIEIAIIAFETDMKYETIIDNQ